jgi:hypothetical protein
VRSADGVELLPKVGEATRRLTIDKGSWRTEILLEIYSLVAHQSRHGPSAMVRISPVYLDSGTTELRCRHSTSSLSSVSVQVKLGG